MICEKCNKPMIKRNGKYGAFMGCTAFPKCRNIVKIGKKPAPKKQLKNWGNFNPSTFQAAIKDVFVNLHNNIIVQAVAGSGKTTLLTWLASLLGDDVVNAIFLAFNKKIATELGDKLPDNFPARTLHSLGFELCRQNLGHVKVEKDKVFFWLRTVIDMENEKFLINPVKSLVSIWKNTTLKTTLTDQELDDLAVLFNVEIKAEIKSRVFDLCRKALELPKHSIDLDDMVFLPAINGWSKGFDLVFVDECQDLNPVQLQLLKNLTVKRFVFVGDSMQAIYGFRGADSESMQKITSFFDCVTMPLSLSYRNSKAVTQLIQQTFPDIDHTCLDNAIEGEIVNIDLADFSQLVANNDLVICRTNAPLVAPVFELLKNGVKAFIEGRDIGEKLTLLLAKVDGATLPELLDNLEVYTLNKIAELQAKGSRYKNSIMALQDNFEVIETIAENCTTLQGLYKAIETLFANNGEGICFSSIHKAKGLEAKRVIILRPDLLPHPNATTDQEIEQERNLLYVALSRPLETLVMVHGE